MLQRINHLLEEGVDFAFETTLSTRSYVSFVKKAQGVGYKVTLLYFWLDSPDFAIQRVAIRVEEGGHNIPADIIKRRYYRGIYNLVNLYIPTCDNWHVVDNRDLPPVVIASQIENLEKVVINNDIWISILKQSEYNGR